MRTIVLVAFACACHTGSQTSADASASAIDPNAYPLRLNPSANGQILVMGGAEGCHNVPGDVDLGALMGAINKSEPTSCDALSDPAWQTCRFGEVYAKADKSECICRSGGKEPRTMTCPAK
jgi:hypothetical protein